MGEYADMDVDANIDSWRGGNWLPFWPSEAQAGKPLHPVYTQAVKTCRSCGRGFLFWREHEGKWRLHHYALLDGEDRPRFILHRCGYDAAGNRRTTPAGRHAERQDPQGLGPKDEHAVPEGQAPKGQRS